MVLEQLGMYIWEKKKQTNRNLNTKLSPSQKFTDLDVKHKTIKFLEDNIGENLDDLSDTF